MAKKKKPPIKKKSPYPNPTSKGENQMPDPTQSTQKPILKPVPAAGKVGPLSFCQKRENDLKVIIQNEGGDVPADTEVKVEVNFLNKGSQTQVLPRLLSGKQSDLYFKFPPNAFDPDCEFDIIIYIGDQRHRTTSGICAGEIHCFPKL